MEVNNQILKTLNELIINFKDIELDECLVNVINSFLIDNCKSNESYHQLIDILTNNGDIFNLELIVGLVYSNRTDSYEKTKQCLALIPKVKFITKKDLYYKGNDICLNPLYDNFKSYTLSSGKDALNRLLEIRKVIIMYKAKFFDENKLEELLGITSDYIIQLLEKVPKGGELAEFLNNCDFYQNRTDAKLLAYYNKQNFENNSFCRLTKQAINYKLSDKFITTLKYKFAVSQLDFNTNLTQAQNSVLEKGNDALVKSIIFKDNGLCNISLNKDGITGIMSSQDNINNLRSTHISIPSYETIALRLNTLGYYAQLVREFLKFIKTKLTIQQFEFKHIELLTKDFCSIFCSCFRNFLGIDKFKLTLNDEESLFFLSCVLKEFSSLTIASNTGPRHPRAHIIENIVKLIDNSNFKNIVTDIFSNKSTYELIAKIWPKEDNVTTLHFILQSMLSIVKIKSESIEEIYHSILSNLFENKQMFGGLYHVEDKSHYYYNYKDSLLDNLNKYTNFFKINFFKKQKLTDELIDENSQNKELLISASKNSTLSNKSKAYVKLCLSNL